MEGLLGTLSSWNFFFGLFGSILIFISAVFLFHKDEQCIFNFSFFSWFLGFFGDSFWSVDYFLVFCDSWEWVWVSSSRGGNVHKWREFLVIICTLIIMMRIWPLNAFNRQIFGHSPDIWPSKMPPFQLVLVCPVMYEKEQINTKWYEHG